MVARSGVAQRYEEARANAPSGVMPGQWVADPGEDEVVVFVIGMRVNRWRRLRSWLPVFLAMPRMIRELEEDPASGLLAAQVFWSGRVFMVKQHWASAEQLGRYARDPQRLHAPAWTRWNSSRNPASADVGIFHETYVVPRDGIETRYANAAPSGLAAAHPVVPRLQRRRRSRADHRVEGPVPGAGEVADSSP